MPAARRESAPTYARPTASPTAIAVLVREAWSTRDPERWSLAPEGRGRPAMLIPGFLAGDPSLSRMARWLRAAGWVTARAGLRANVDCMEPTVEALEVRLEAAVEKAGHRALLVGQSRGGTLGRVLAVRRPDLVETLLTLGSPVLDQHATSRTTATLVSVLATLGTAGVPGLFSRSCLDGSCCETSREQLTHPISDDVRYIALYSRDDAVVSWQACLDTRAELVEVRGTHSGMGMNATVWARIAELLTS